MILFGGETAGWEIYCTAHTSRTGYLVIGQIGLRGDLAACVATRGEAKEDLRHDEIKTPHECARISTGVVLVFLSFCFEMRNHGEMGSDSMVLAFIDQMIAAVMRFLVFVKLFRAMRK